LRRSSAGSTRSPSRLALFGNLSPAFSTEGRVGGAAFCQRASPVYRKITVALHTIWVLSTSHASCFTRPHCERRHRRWPDYLQS
jgi:hypothetical protein